MSIARAAQLAILYLTISCFSLRKNQQLVWLTWNQKQPLTWTVAFFQISEKFELTKIFCEMTLRRL